MDFRDSYTTALSSLKKCMVKTHADVLLAQETGILVEDTEDFVDWAKERVWRVVLTPTVKSTSGGRPSAGVLVAGRNGIGLATLRAGGPELVPSRLVAVAVEVPGWPRILVGSAYLWTGAVLQPCHRHILARRAEAVERSGGMALLGGRFQMSKKVLE